MVDLLLVQIFLILLMLLVLSITSVFCFWSVYLLDAIQRKLKVYKHALRCIQQGGDDSLQQMLAYDSKTEFVKFVFLFFMNLVESLGFLFGYIRVILGYAKELHLYHSALQSGISLSLNTSSDNGILLTNVESYERNLRYLPDFFFVLSIILMASLCMYLSERFARKSWIKSDNIPFLIGFFLVLEIEIHFLTLFCVVEIIAMWCYKLLLLIAFLIANKEYKKLVSIIDWSIIDLQVSRNYQLLERQLSSKRKMVHLFTYIWTGIILMIISDFVGSFLFTLSMVLQGDNSSAFQYASLCVKEHFVNPEIHIILSIISYADLVIGLIGVSFILIPYTGYGLSKMCIVLWRLIRGKTGYRTHFHNDLDAPII